MLLLPRKSKFKHKKRGLSCKVLNNKWLRTSLISRVFATNNDVGCFHASYERHFVKKIQHFISFHAAYHHFYEPIANNVWTLLIIIHLFLLFSVSWTDRKCFRYQQVRKYFLISFVFFVVQISFLYEETVIGKKKKNNWWKWRSREKVMNG